MSYLWVEFVLFVKNKLINFMSSKRAMRQAQKQAYAKHRSNITNSRFELKKKFLTKNKEEKKGKN